jgi:hypothetical protein
VIASSDDRVILRSPDDPIARSPDHRVIASSDDRVILRSPDDPIARSPDLFHFFMRRVLAATITELLKLQPFRRRLPVLGRRIIPLFAIAAL